MKDNKHLELAKKLKALAERGVDGEKSTAAKMLAAHLKRHGITLDDISDEKIETQRFNVPEHWHSFFNQIAASMDLRTFRAKYRPKQGIIVECTKGQTIELDIKYNFYKKEYEKELRVFFKAFVAKNDLYRYVDKKELKKKTPEEQAEDFRAAMMAEAIKKSQFVKRIEK